MQVSAVNNVVTRPLQNRAVTPIFSIDSVKNFIEHDSKQVASIAPESNRLKSMGLDTMAKGGLGCVAMELPENWIQKEGFDVRSFFPYHAPENPKGKMIVGKPSFVLKKEFDKTKGILVENKELSSTLRPDEIKYVDFDYQLKDGEHFVFLNGKKEANGAYKYIRLEATDVKGTIKKLSENELKIETMPYRFFKAADMQKNYSKAKHGTLYFVYTPEVATMSEAYGGKAYQTGQIVGMWHDLYYANENRAIADALPQLAKKEGFDPRNLIPHDRMSFVVQDEIALRSAKGENFFANYKIHSIFHNIGRTYQGYMESPLAALRIMFHEDEFKKLQALPEFELLKYIDKKRDTKLPPEIAERIAKILDPYLGSMMDSKGTYNISMIPVVNTQINPQISTAGTVSRTFDKEMKTLPDISPGMVEPLSKTNTISTTNGSTPANLGIDTRKDIGKGGNTLSAEINSYTPYKPMIQDSKLVNYTVDYEGKNFIVKYKNKKGRYLKNENGEYVGKFSVVDSVKAKEVNDNIKAQEIRLKKMLAETKKKYDISLEYFDKTSDAKKKKKLLKILKRSTKKIKNLTRKLEVLNHSGIVSSVKDAKQKNKQWLIDIIGKCATTKKKEIEGKIYDVIDTINQDALNSVFFNEVQLNPGDPAKKCNVLGVLKPFEKGDKLILGWGRPDPQKGMATTAEAFYKFFTNEDIPLEKRLKTKFLFGAGVWEHSDPDYLNIAKYMKKMQEYKGGVFSGNVCYVDGFFPNRLVACADFSIFTSRFEPCGITPLESFSSGTPVISINTGGAPDFIKTIENNSINEANGFLTKNPYMLSAEELGFTAEDIKKKGFETILDNKRREILSDQTADCIRQAVELNENQYDCLSRNACIQSVDWHENSAYNLGETANQRYKSKVFELDENLKPKKARSNTPMTKLTNEIGSTTIKTDLTPHENVISAKQKNLSEGVSNSIDSGSKCLKRLLNDKRTYYAAAAIAAVAGIAAYALCRDKSESAKFKTSKIGNMTIYY